MNEQHDTLLETALAALPLTPLPEGFMARVRQKLPPRVVPVPRFQLEFLDIALPFAVGVFAAAFLLVMGWYSGNLSLSWLPAPANPFSPSSLTNLPLTTWAGIGVLILAIEAVLTLVGVLAYTLWNEGNPTFTPRS